MGRLRMGRLLVTLALAVSVLAACTQENSEAAAPTTLSVQEQSTFANNDIVIVKAYFDDEATGRQIATTFEPVEAEYDKGYLVLSLSSDEFAKLRAEGADLGIELELDEAATLEQSQLLKRLNSAEDDSISLQSIPRFACYRTVEETFTSAEAIVAEYPNLAAWSDEGNSWRKTAGEDGYDMWVLKLTNQATSGDKPKAFITSAIHAREYTTAELMTRLAEYLVENYGSDPDITWILDTSEVHLMLQSNPDGRKIAETGVLWRKNVNENYCNGDGADLNRNFAFEWNTGGSSGNQCNDTYRGPSAASEPEVQAVQNYLLENFADNRPDDPSVAAPLDTPGLYIDVHSSGKLMLWPWGNRETPAPNGSQLQTLGRKLSFFNDHLPTQSVGLYPTSGTTTDFAYGELGLSSYTYELGTKFFESCSYFEDTLLPDNLASLIYALKVTRAPYQTPSGPDALNLELSTSGANATLSATLDDTRFNNSNGREPAGEVTQARYTIDTPPWEAGANPRALSASDGSFNSSTEDVQATINTSGLSEGQHTVYVQGRDDEGTWGAVSAIFLNTDGTTSPPSEGETFTGTLSGSGERAYEPDGTWYQSGAGQQSGTLSGPGSSNFDLYLFKWNSAGRRWQQVARSTDTSSSEQINYDGAAGYYLWLINSRTGSGDYSFRLNRP